MFAWILKTKPEKNGAAGSTVDAVCGTGQRRRGELDEAIEEGLDAEVGQGAAEEHRRQLAGGEGVAIEAGAGAVQQVELLGQLPVRVFADGIAQGGVVEAAPSAWAPCGRPTRPRSKRSSWRLQRS